MSGNNEYDYTGLEIAVIGMDCRFPGANNTREFWENLTNSVESISFFSDEELKREGVPPQLMEQPGYIRAKGVLEDIEYFEAGFFNFTPSEAELMDPQLRIFFECVWHALEDSGYNPETYTGAIGMFAGNAVNHYWVAKTIFAKQFQVFGKFKADLLNTHFSTRVSYHLNLKGPSITVNTTCSTSLVAVHQACLSLLSGECDMALAGGVGLDLPQASGYLFMEGLILAPDGHCRAFAADAKGTVVGSGAGVVVLKPLENAKEDGDHIYALVKGTAINNDGFRKVGYTAPSVEGQAQAIRAAYRIAEVDPTTVSYVETHGTGTELGDIVEIEALNMVFKNSDKQSIPIGSVKSNVGHLDTAAGAAGFIKTVLSLKNRKIPPSLHFTIPNPKIDFTNSPFYVNNRLREWNGKSGAPLRAGVSSFGLGGTNVHVVLEEWPETRRAEQNGPDSGGRANCLLLLSARTPTALDRQTANLVEYLSQHPETALADIAYTLQQGRKPLPCRKMAVCSSREDALDRLREQGRAGKVRTYSAKKGEPTVVFLIPGQGSQYINMGKELYEQEPIFRREMDRCFEIAKPLLGFDLKDILYVDEETLKKQNRQTDSSASGQDSPAGEPGPIDRTELTQPVVFIFEYALAKLLMNWGIKPRAMIGYSMGEYVAAALSGVFSLEDALNVVIARGQLMQKTPGAIMLSVPLPEAELKPLLNPKVTLAIINGPSCIVAGKEKDVNEFEKQMKERRLMCAPLNLAHGVHSPLMASIRAEFEEMLAKVTLHPPRIPYISNVSGQWITVEEAIDPYYWGTHLCNTVQFSAGVKELLKETDAVFIEIGPGRILSNIVRSHAGENSKARHKIVNLVKHQQEKAADDYYLLSKLGELWLYGVTIDWSGFYGDEKRWREPLPLYPFERRRYWIDGDPFRNMKDMQSANGPITSSEETPVPVVESQPEPGIKPESPEISPDFYDEVYEAPRDELEQAVAQVWQEFLGFDRIGIHSNFFDINGDSLAATQMVTRLQQIFPVEISLQAFFAEPTIAHLAKVIKELLVEKVKSLSEEELLKLAGQ